MQAKSLGFLAVITVFLIASPTKAEETLSGSQIKDTIVGKTLKWKKRGSDPVQIEYKADGKLNGFVPGHGRSDEGKWWVEGDNFCRQWSRWRNGKKSCTVWTREGNKVKAHKEGKFTGWSAGI